MMNLDLDRYFRKGSKAHKVAKILLDGKPHSRPELADRAKVVPTTIPRVVGILKKNAGVRIETTMGENGRTAIYRVVGTPSAMDVSGALIASYVPEKDPLMLRVESLGVEDGRVTIRLSGGGRDWLCSFPPDASIVDGIGIRDEYPMIGLGFLDNGSIVIRLGGGFGADLLFHERVPSDT